jgi:hypothetical protein
MGEWGGVASLVLTSALDGCAWSASLPCHFIPRERVPGYMSNKTLDGPKSRSGRCGVEKNLSPFGHRTPATQAITYQYIGAVNRNAYKN